MTTTRQAFTAIELLIIVGVITLLMALSAPAIGKAIADSQIDAAASAVISTHDIARGRAVIGREDSSARYFGTVITQDPNDPSSQAWCGLTWSAGLPSADDLLYTNGKVHSELTAAELADPTIHPVAQSTFNGDLRVLVDGSELNGSFGWLSQYRTGTTIRSNQPGTTVHCNVGTATSPLATSLEIRSLDDRLKRAVSIYALGLGHVRSL